MPTMHTTPSSLYPSIVPTARAADRVRNRRLFWAIVIGFVLVSLFALGVRTLAPPDEGRYAEMAREMVASGDWITPRLNGIKYFEKPPLQTWMNALTFTVFGLGEWQARLWTGLCGLLGVGLTGYAGARVFGARIGQIAALVLGSCLYWAACSQIDSLDMSLTGMLTVALCSLLIAQRDAATAAERRNWMLACWAGMALAMLAKGLVALVLPGGVLVCYTVLARDWRIWTRLHAAKGLLLFLLVAAPWFVLVGLRNPEQPHFFFIHEHIDRFLLKEHHRDAAWWIFLALIVIGSVPWLGVLPRALLEGTRRAPGVFQPRLLLLVWIGFIILFFSLSHSKLPGYILPVFPAVALLIACSLADASRRMLMVNAGLLVALGTVLVAVAPLLPRFVRHADEAALYCGFRPWLLAAGLAAIAGGALALYAAGSVQRMRATVLVALSGFAMTQLLCAGAEPYGRARADVDLVPAIRAHLQRATRLYSVGLYEQSLTFYLGRTVTLVDYRDEFDFGLQQQPALAVDSVAAFAQVWRERTAAGAPTLAIVRADIFAQLRRAHLPMRIVQGDARRALIVNP